MVSQLILAYFCLVLNFLIFSYLNELTYLKRSIIVTLVISLITILIFNFMGTFDSVISNNTFNLLLLWSGSIVIIYLMTSLMTAYLIDVVKQTDKKGRNQALKIFDWTRLHFVCIAVSFIQLMTIFNQFVSPYK